MTVKLFLHSSRFLLEQPLTDFNFDLVSYLAEKFQLVLFAPFECRRIFERPMQPLADPREDRAAFFRFAAHRNQETEMNFSEICSQWFGVLAAGVNTDLLEYLDG